MSLPFLKMHGLGNDFVLIDALTPFTSHILNPELARRICDRRFGVGADQVLWLKPAQAGNGADARMEIFNANGSMAEMCGNGIRALVLYLFRYGPKPGQHSYLIETLAGIKKVQIHGELISVDMGIPVLGGGFLKEGEVIQVAGRQVRFYEVNLGNPHAVIFADRLDVVQLEQLGPAIETHLRFPHRTNVEFVQVLNASEIRVRVWERGAGATLACGTGACASAVASLATSQVKGDVQVHLPGGTLQIRWPGVGSSVVMTGPAQEVFRGEFIL
jgi:diaminopimelate epimerase